MTRIILIPLLLAALVAGLSAQERRPRRRRPAPEKVETPAAAPEKKKEEDERYLAIVGATVHPVSGPVIHDGTVIVKGSKIVQVGRQVRVPEGAEVVDAKGRHVCPGFVAVISNGVLGTGGSRGSSKEKIADQFDPYSRNMLLALSAGITTAHQGPTGSSGNIFQALFGGLRLGGSPKGMTGGVVAKLTYGAIEGFEMTSPAGVYFSFGTTTGTQYEETRSALREGRDYHRKRKEWIQGLTEGKKDQKEPKGSEVAQAIARCIDRELPLFIGVGKRSHLEACLALCDEYKVPMVIHGGTEAWTIAPEIGRRPIRMILTPRAAPSGFGERDRPHRDPLSTEPNGWTIENAAILSRAGVPWAIATKFAGINFDISFGRELLSLPLEACFAVRGGASNEEALRGITLTAAEVLGVDDRVGSLEPGKDADILLLDHEPLDYRAFVQKTWVDGKLRYDKAKQPFWSHIPTDRSEPLKDWWPYGSWTSPEVERRVERTMDRR